MLGAWLTPEAAVVIAVGSGLVFTSGCMEAPWPWDVGQHIKVMTTAGLLMASERSHFC